MQGVGIESIFCPKLRTGLDECASIDQERNPTRMTESNAFPNNETRGDRWKPNTTAFVCSS